MNINELEDMLLTQIRKLNDDSVMDDKEKCRELIDRSKTMSDLTNSYISVQRMKLDAVKLLKDPDAALYESYLGITDGRNGKVQKSLGR